MDPRDIAFQVYSKLKIVLLREYRSENRIFTTVMNNKDCSERKAWKLSKEKWFEALWVNQTHLEAFTFERRTLFAAKLDNEMLNSWAMFINIHYRRNTIV